MMEDLAAACKTQLESAQTALPRPLRVAEPFVGMGGFREVMRNANWAYEAVNVYDTDSRLRSFYELLKKEDSEVGPKTVLNFGPEGDVLLP